MLPYQVRDVRLKLRREETIAYTMVVPYVAVIVVLIAALLSSNVVTSFTARDGTLTLEHYRDTLGDDVFPTILKNTVTWTCLSAFGQILLGLVIALLLNTITAGQSLFRTVIIILPWGTLDIVAGVMWKWMYNDLYGVINDVLQHGGIIADPIAWLADPGMAMAAVVIANVWKGFVLAAMFFLARLRGIPEYLFEVAEIDGAGTIGRFFHVTLPQLRGVLLTTTLLVLVWTINYFPLIFIMTGGGPANGTETLVTYVYKLSFRFLEYGRAAALSNVLFLIILAVTAIFMVVINREEAE